MVLFLPTFTLLCIVLQTGLLIHEGVASKETFAKAVGIEPETLEIFEKWGGQFPNAFVEERGIWSNIKAKWKKFVATAKQHIASLLVKFMQTKHYPQRCDEGIGCFFYENRMSLKIGGPQYARDVNTTFYFFKNGSDYLDDLLNENKTKIIPNKTYTLENWTLTSTKDVLNTEFPLMVVTHGLTGSKRTPWMMPLVLALLENVNCTVLVVDWEKGAAGSYPDAGINTPMAGALISRFLEKIVKDAKIRPDNITLIGFSMGAQVMGFAGRHFKNYTNTTLGRISGLDPAGWLYENSNATLTKSDATYVDVIHTNAGSITQFRIGLNESVGHVDFYPNGGTVQTGCPKAPKFIPYNYIDVITCSHYKATYLYIESLKNHTCKFVSYGCNSWEDFKSGNCTAHISEDKKGLLGFYSYTAEGQGNQYLYTNADPPYCRGNDTRPPPKFEE